MQWHFALVGRVQRLTPGDSVEFDEVVGDSVGVDEFVASDI